MKHKIIILLISSVFLFNCKGTSTFPKTKEEVVEKPIIEVQSAFLKKTPSTTHKDVIFYNYNLNVIVNKYNVKFSYLCAKKSWLDIKVKNSNGVLSSSYLSQSGDTITLNSSFANNQLLATCKDSLEANEVAIHYTISDSIEMILKIPVSEFSE